MMMTGARSGASSGIRRFMAGILARDVSTFVVPGSEIARAYGIDLFKAGLRVVDTPRHAAILLVVGPIAKNLQDAVAVTYAQMPRPRVLLALGVDDPAMLPVVDIMAPLSQDGLLAGVVKFRKIMAADGFHDKAIDFTASALEIQIDYTCPMHPEVVSDKPGSCPKCGMTLVPRETAVGTDHVSHAALGNKPVTSKGHSDHKHSEHKQGHHGHDHGGTPGVSEAAAGYTCPMHPDVVSDKPGSCPECGMTLVPVGEASADHSAHKHSNHKHEHHGHDHGGTPGASEAAADYICPMHPDVVSDKPGSCPECGMTLVPVGEASVDHSAHKHSGHKHSDHKHSEHKHHGHDHGGKPGVSEVAAGYTCPMHPDVVSDKPGSCPECGMTLVPAGVASVDHSDHKHSGHKHGHHEHGQMAKIDGIEPGFMSMVDLTKDLPRSSDGLQMDWVKVPFGPFFPGLPGGLGLDLTLDGDTVAASDLRSLVGYVAPLVAAPLTVENFVAEMVSRMRQAPVSYKILAFKAMEAAAGAAPAEGQMRSRVAVLERERIASHLSWLSSFGTQASFSWLAEQAAFLQIKVQAADIPQMAHITPAILALLRRLQRTPLLRMRLVGIGQLEATVKGITGPVARGLGQIRDARADDAAFAALDFKAALRTGGDAFARFYVRCDEIRESLRLIALAGLVDRSEMAAIGSVSGDGAAIVETPRGKAGLKIHLEDGMITEAELETPSTGHMGLVSSMIEQQELGDALVAVASLDLSPWEIKL